MLYTRKCVTKAASNTQRKSISTVVTKEPKKSYGLIHHLPKPLKLTLQNVSRITGKHFPKSHLLHKIFNRNTIKVSHSCMNNASQIIKLHNRNVSNKKEKQINPYNCRNKSECPLN